MLLFAGMNTAMAQDAPKQKMSPEKRAERQTQMMVNKLNLNDQQAEQVMVINRDAAEKMRPLIEERKGNREDIKTVVKDRDMKLQSVLTDEQWNQYDEVRKERMQKMVEKRKIRK